MFRRSFATKRHQSSIPRRRGSMRFSPRPGKTGSFIPSSRYIHKAEPMAPVTATPTQHRFEDFPIEAVIKENIKHRGYTVPTPIQDQAIPHILNGKDVVGIANTGTGKTAAFLVPLINKLMKNQNSRVLIVVPTRELAVQINTELTSLTRSLRFRSTLIMGGASMYRQLESLKNNPEFIIATPGRLKDLLMRRLIPLAQFHSVVLDEVDRMVDIGFIRDIKYIIAQLPSYRQSLFFSATVSPDIHAIIRTFLTNPVTVSVKSEETPHAIDQDIIRVNKHEKIATLESLLRKEEFKKVLIFGRTKWGVEKLSKALQLSGFQADSIHGNKSQGQRLRALTQFRNNRLQVLVATDVVARGVDIENVSHVINFDEPSSYTDYIHRIGRTGRANKQGKALTFVE